MHLRDKTILLTGATSGLGLALTEALAPVNNALLVIGRKQAALDALAKRYPNIHPYCCDLATPDALVQTAQVILQRHPEVAVVINNAGTQYASDHWLDRFDVAEVLAEVHTNFVAPVVLAAYFAKAFLNQRKACAIVNISSALALAPKRQAPVYCATKAALSSFSRSLRYQLTGTQVAVHDVILPLVATPMTEGRTGQKISASAAAHAIVTGVNRQQPAIYVGKTKLLPWLLRLSPSLVAYLLRGK